MKLIALVVVVLCTVASEIKAGLINEEVLETMRGVLAGCVKEAGASEADVAVIMKHMPAENKETKCLRSCMIKHFNMMNGDGKFVKDVAVKMAELYSKGDAQKLQIAIDVANICNEIAVPNDHCEAAELYEMCMIDEAKKHGVDLSAV